MSFIRIISGKHRSRKLQVLDSDGLRPTTDRVRETLFNWLQFDIAGATCLDCFAGTGALGFEALSRGAESVLMLEANNKVAQQLRVNKEALEEAACDVQAVDAVGFLKHCSQTFDIIFCDPPFQSDLAEQVLPLLPSLLNPHGLVYLEIGKKQKVELPECFEVLKHKTMGQVQVFLLKLNAHALA